MKRPRRILLFVLLLGAALAGVKWLRAFGHPALTAYVAQLRSQGERLTLQELSAANSPSTNNTLVDMAQVLTTLGPPPANVTNFQALQFVELNQPRVAWRLNRPHWEGADGTRNGSWKDLNARLDVAGASLRELQRILEQPAPNRGRPTFHPAIYVAWEESRAAATWLSCATLAQLRDGRRQDALANMRAMAALADLHREEFPLAVQMTRVAVADMGLDVTWDALQAENWSDEQLATLQRCWEKHDFLEAVQRGLEGERARPLEFLAKYRESSFASTDYKSLGNPLVKWSLYWVVMGNDALYALRHLQTQVELAREFREGRPFNEVFEASAKLGAAMNAKARSRTRVFYLISILGITDYKNAILIAAKAETKRRLAVTAIALQRYELMHGKPAETLAALVPDFLPEVPRDVIDGKPLRLRPWSDGTWRLYSIGIDGKDDGGDNSGDPAAVRSGLCEGRDAVWPLTVKPEHIGIRQEL